MEFVAVAGPDGRAHEWVAGSRVVVPSVSIGAVAQLSLDLLVDSLQMARVGHLRHPGVLPMVGFDRLDPGSPLVTSLDVFFSAEHKLYAVHQRAPASKAHREAFREDLAAWLKSLPVEYTILVTGMDAAQRRDPQLTSHLRYLVSTSLKEAFAATLEAAEDTWTELEALPPTEAVKTGVFIPNGGMSRTFFEKACEESLPVLVCVCFCSPGDNRALAFHTVSRLCALLGVKPAEPWREPQSWLLLYGSKAPQVLYG